MVTGSGKPLGVDVGVGFGDAVGCGDDVGCGDAVGCGEGVPVAVPTGVDVIVGEGVPPVCWAATSGRTPKVCRDGQ